ncbi:MAG: NifB/NifX family molybdenum-iron cluster-binding protein [Candidatus Omnitrophica bacterium]|nr:NifB/NifX family molybdenum-iron cluster-binding protein [Candidatus Omnitrophota bacterium]MBU1997308.1 NifB/NifX family molybdenum-iron cluster-binding protein [Candidatus Omnitrophota bacterium]MBU4332913.1 NifB/NifX family molybdenum-iron cluster-binding protein [Candidatus Omnitrophota bacterium]
MKICITSEGNNLDSKVDPRFGRCQYFILIDTDTSQFEAIQNQNVNGSGGVGVQSGQIVAEKQAKVVLTGKVGPNASQTLTSAGIEVVLDVEGTVKEALERFKKGELKSAKGPNADEKSGLNK